MLLLQPAPSHIIQTGSSSNRYAWRPVSRSSGSNEPTNLDRRARRKPYTANDSNDYDEPASRHDRSVAKLKTLLFN